MSTSLVPPVFIVDDNEDDLALTTTILRKGGAKLLVSASSGEEAVDKLSEVSGSPRDQLPLVFVLDVKMPGMTGLELLEWIRAHHVFDHVPVVMWSSSDDPRDVERAAKLGAQCYLGKYPPYPVVEEMLRLAAEFRHSESRPRFFAQKANLLHGRAGLPDLRRK